MIILPAVDLMEGLCVRLVRGDPSSRTIYGDPVEIAKGFEGEGAEWIHLVDLDAAMGLGDNSSLVARIVEEVEVKVEVAGGIRSLEKASRLVEAGASRVVLGTSAIRDPSFIRSVSEAIGSERVSMAVDVKNGVVMVEGWKKEAGLEYPAVIEILNDYPFSTLILTCVEVDGTLQGPNLEVIGESLKISEKQVYAAGGIGSLEDLKTLARIGVKGAIIGKALYEGRIRLREALEVGDC
ncbi:MAG: 1-(5-phosphoribosyl)-5-[(5-phosphoribosylamino)methylideneamino]imidazole-4-carboxamide isomerase [Candidatus Bathyarchaeia archaeon]|nr:1-(5-phosphoribosyl)-5-[(5-phosphoribosylamino)methylideneamino]imidazole-4-carboxamide isomerase [Candidatus Bathyarchaeota archaeon]